MATIATNIDPKLLENMDENTMNLVSKTKTNKNKKEVEERPQCNWIVDFTTIGKAYAALGTKDKKGNEKKIFIVRSCVDNEIREIACNQCSLSSSGNSAYCTTHKKKHDENPEGARNFSELEQKCGNDEDVRLAVEDDAFFDKMKKERGHRPKKLKLEYKFPSKDNFVFQILVHKNGKLKTQLLRAAQQILDEYRLQNGRKVSHDSGEDSDFDNNDDDESSSEEEEEVKPVMKKKNEVKQVKEVKEVVKMEEPAKRGRKPKVDETTTNNSNVSTKKSSKKVNKPRSTQAVDTDDDIFGSNDENEDVEEEDEKVVSTTNAKAKPVVLPPSIEHEFPSDDEDEDDGDEYEKITSLNGSKLAYYLKSKQVYLMNEDGDSDLLGKLVPIKNELASIRWKNEYYTVLTKITYKDDGKKYLYSELDDKVFDFHKRLVGNVKKQGKKFRIEFV